MNILGINEIRIIINEMLSEQKIKDPVSSVTKYSTGKSGTRGKLLKIPKKKKKIGTKTVKKDVKVKTTNKLATGLPDEFFEGLTDDLIKVAAVYSAATNTTSYKVKRSDKNTKYTYTGKGKPEKTVAWLNANKNDFK